MHLQILSGDLFRLMGRLLSWALLVVFVEGSTRGYGKRDRNELANCGELLGRVASVCGSQQHASRILCCDALEEWNDEFCWCDENAFAALSNVAKDLYAFSLRDKSCNATVWFRPPTSQPSQTGPTVSNTCPNLKSLQAEDDREGCRNIDLVRLREGRKATIRTLLNTTMKSSETRDIQRWKRAMDNIFMQDATMFFAGFGYFHPRKQIKDYLLSQNLALGGSFWKYPTIFKLYWRAPNIASYQASKYIGPYAYSRIDLVTFEKCSPKIKALYFQTSDYARLTQQYVYIEESDRMMKPLMRTPVQWCRLIESHCQGEDFPFSSATECKQVYEELQRKGRVACMQDGSFVPQLGFHGDTTSCRATYLSLAQLDPQKYCCFVGKESGGRCAQGQCPLDAYEDIFRKPNPRFPGTGGFVCHGSSCHEIWPS